MIGVKGTALRERDQSQRGQLARLAPVGSVLPPPRIPPSAATGRVKEEHLGCRSHPQRERNWQVERGCRQEREEGQLGREKEGVRTGHKEGGVQQRLRPGRMPILQERLLTPSRLLRWTGEEKK